MVVNIIVCVGRCLDFVSYLRGLVGKIEGLGGFWGVAEYTMGLVVIWW